MLLLLFQSGHDRFALNVKQVVEVIPLVRLERIPHAPDCVAGVFNFRGGPTPVLDLNKMISGRPCVERLSTRIVLLDYWGHEEQRRVIGLMAEQVTETIKCSESSFHDIGVQTDEAPFLGGVTTDDRGMIQLINVRHLIPDSVVNLDL